MIDQSAVGYIRESERTTHMCVVVAIFLSAYTTGGEIIHTFFISLITEIEIGTERIEYLIVHSPERIGKTLHSGYVAP